MTRRLYRPLSRLLVVIFLLLLSARTRRLVKEMDGISFKFEELQDLEEEFLAKHHHNRLAQGTALDTFLSAVERLDGLSGSLLLLLSAALTERKDHDDDFAPRTVQQRCTRYNLTVSNRTKPRRIFAGSLIADDSWHVLAATAMEYRDLLHTIVFVETNTTLSGTPRTLRFTPGSERYRLLTDKRLWGETTSVHVDLFVTTDPSLNGLGQLNDQRNQILNRWKLNGMMHDDIGFLSETDEIATRDVLLALQTCEIPEFQSPPTGHDCIQPKLSSSTLVYEGSPQCLQIPRRLSQPDWILGECIQGIGDPSHRLTITRIKQSSSAERILEWNDLVGNVRDPESNKTIFVKGPLWDATDIRMIPSRQMAGTTSHGIPNYLHTGVHLHNFFDSFSVLRTKYETYRHPRRNASSIPSESQQKDLGFMIDCLNGKHDASSSNWRQARIDPIHGKLAAFGVLEYADLRHNEWKHELALDKASKP
jgi:Glycosyltransferase family 17